MCQDYETETFNEDDFAEVSEIKKEIAKACKDKDPIDCLRAMALFASQIMIEITDFDEILLEERLSYLYHFNNEIFEDALVMKPVIEKHYT